MLLQRKVPRYAAIFEDPQDLGRSKFIEIGHFGGKNNYMILFL